MESCLFTQFRQDNIFTVIPGKIIWAVKIPVPSVFLVKWHKEEDVWYSDVQLYNK